MRFWRKKQKWQVIAALLFVVWILMGTRKINVNAENMEAESFTGETAVETEEETTEKTVTAGIGYRAASADSEGITEQLVSDIKKHDKRRNCIFKRGGAAISAQPLF